MLQPMFCLTYPTCSCLWSSDTERHLQFGEWNDSGSCCGSDYVDDNYDDDDICIQHIEQYELPQLAELSVVSNECTSVG
jgi:hypothetical protein